MPRFQVGQFVKIKNPSWFKATTVNFKDWGMDINGPLEIVGLWKDKGVYVGKDPIPWFFYDLDFIEPVGGLEELL